MPDLLGHTDPVDTTLALLDHVQARIQATGLDSLNPTERQILALYDVWTQVQAGGFNQYLWNPAADHATDALAGLALVQDAHCVRVLEQAFAALGPGGLALSHDERCRVLQDWDEDAWEPLEDLADELLDGPRSLPECIAALGRLKRAAIRA